MCHAAISDQTFIDAFEEFVCKSCRYKHFEYHVISKSDMIEEYLITESTIRLMPFLLKDNPKNPRWTQMKLYLRKHALTKSIERWGSDDALKSEKQRRAKEQFEKGLESTKGALSASLHEDDDDGGESRACSILLNMIKDSGISSTVSDDHNKEAQKRKGPAKKVTDEERRRRAKISRMAAVIRGTDVSK
jgi:hypothetical protein